MNKTRHENKDELEDEDENEDQEEEDVAVERIDSWFMYVHVLEKIITVSCGDASQRVKWLAHVGIGKLEMYSSICFV